MRTLLLAVFLCICSIDLQAQSTSRTADFSIQDLKWLSGIWQGNMFGGIGTEYWTIPEGNTITNMLRIIEKDSTQIIEFKIIEEKNRKIILRFKHFKNNYLTLEKEEPLSFTLKEIVDNKYLFESDTQNIPKRITYENINNTVMKVKVEIVSADGKINSFITEKKKLSAGFNPTW